MVEEAEAKINFNPTLVQFKPDTCAYRKERYEVISILH